MNGILIVDKPSGLTSHDIVDIIRKKFRVKKAGHAGTLDPMATGLLLILVGSYTKLSNTFLNSDKSYEGVMTLGAVSDTLDADGKVSPTGAAIPVESLSIEEAFKKFTGPIEQKPPMFSAVKIKGKKLYELARRGEVVDVKPRPVVIKEFKLISFDGNDVRFSVACSKGTYIRQLVSDVGSALGCGAYLTALRRTRSGDFLVENGHTLNAIKDWSSEAFESHLVSV